MTASENIERIRHELAELDTRLQPTHTELRELGVAYANADRTLRELSPHTGPDGFTDHDPAWLDDTVPARQAEAARIKVKAEVRLKVLYDTIAEFSPRIAELQNQLRDATAKYTHEQGLELLRRLAAAEAAALEHLMEWRQFFGTTAGQYAEREHLGVGRSIEPFAGLPAWLNSDALASELTRGLDGIAAYNAELVPEKHPARLKAEHVAKVEAAHANMKRRPITGVTVEESYDAHVDGTTSLKTNGLAGNVFIMPVAPVIDE